MANEKARTLAGTSDYKLLLEPVITEKSTRFGEAGNRVVFRVPTTATKTDIRQAIERVFNVKVKAVNTVNQLGKTKRTVRGMAKRQNFKKAYVTLAEGQTISVVEGL
jgi:large subunit ribosomal protein L23